jgi:hypothetical protein
LKKYVITLSIAAFITIAETGYLFLMNKKVEGFGATMQAYKARLETFVQRDARIRNMTQTLRVNYSVSEYEARYYSIIFDDFSQEYGIPWEIYGAIMRCESNFDPTLASDKGAKGIMQMLESTAQEEARILKIRYRENKTLWNDVHATVLGISYLSRAIKEGGIEHGVSIYVGGPNYRTNSKNYPTTTGAYVGEYQTSVYREFERLKHIYTGVVSLNGRDSLLMTDTLELLVDTTAYDSTEISDDTILTVKGKPNGKPKAPKGAMPSVRSPR